MVKVANLDESSRVTRIPFNILIGSKILDVVERMIKLGLSLDDEEEEADEPPPLEEQDDNEQNDDMEDVD